MSYTGRITWETLRTFDATMLSGTYQAIGTPLQFASYICKMVNTSAANVLISIDGVNDIDILPGNCFWLYDEGKVGQSSTLPALPAGTQFYVKSASVGAATTNVYLVTQYIIVG